MKIPEHILEFYFDFFIGERTSFEELIKINSELEHDDDIDHYVEWWHFLNKYKNWE